MKESEKIRQKTPEELKKELNLLKENLANLCFAKETGSLKKIHQIKSVKKKIAQLLTILEEKKLESQKPLENAKPALKSTKSIK